MHYNITIRISVIEQHNSILYKTLAALIWMRQNNFLCFSGKHRDFLFFNQTIIKKERKSDNQNKNTSQL